jgi:hypothetical protein
MKNFFIPSQFLNSIFYKRLISSTSVKKTEERQLVLLKKINQIVSQPSTASSVNTNEVLNSVLTLSDSERKEIIKKVKTQIQQCTDTITKLPSEDPDRFKVIVMRDLHVATQNWLKQAFYSQKAPPTFQQAIEGTELSTSVIPQASAELQRTTQLYVFGGQQIQQVAMNRQQLQTYGKKETAQLLESQEKVKEQLQLAQDYESYVEFKNYLQTKDLSHLLKNDASSLPVARHSLFLDTSGTSVIKALGFEVKRLYNLIVEKFGDEKYKSDVPRDMMSAVSIQRVIPTSELTKEIQSRQLVGRLASQYIFDQLEQKMEESRIQGVILNSEEIHNLIDNLQHQFSSIVKAHAKQLVNIQENQTSAFVVYSLGYADRETILRLYKKVTDRERIGVELGRFQSFLETSQTYQSYPNIFPVDSSTLYDLLNPRGILNRSTLFPAREPNLYYFFQKTGNHQKVFELFANFYNHQYQNLKATSGIEAQQVLKDLIASLHLVNLCKNYQLSQTQCREFFENFDVVYLQSYANFLQDKNLEIESTREELTENYRLHQKLKHDGKASSSGQQPLENPGQQKTIDLLSEKLDHIKKDVGEIRQNSDFIGTARDWFKKWTE